MAACTDVQTYFAARVFYQIGFSVVDVSMTISIANATALTTCIFWLAYVASFYLNRPWIYGHAVHEIISSDGIWYRWAFGDFAIIILIISNPLWGFWYRIHKKAEQMVFTENKSSGWPICQSIINNRWTWLDEAVENCL
jgi:hypothetical protein